MYDVTNEQSFKDCTEWVQQVRRHAWEDVIVVLVANKCDMQHHRVVSPQQGNKMAADFAFRFFEASAKENINVSCVFDYLVDVICRRVSGAEHCALIESNLMELSRRYNHDRKGCEC